jgi:hypothetical protein
LAAYALYHELTTVRSSTAFIPWRTGTSSAIMKLTAGRPRHDVKGNVMRGAYKVLANILALLIVVQAAAMVWAIAGLYNFVDDGGTFDKSLMEEGAETPFTEVAGFMIHFMNGALIVVLSLVLLVVSFFAKVPRGVPVAGVIFALVLAQFALGIAGHSLPFAGLLHGVNALVLFAGTLQAARLAGRPAEASTTHTEPARV